MGAKQSKTEGTIFPDTPTNQQIKLSRLTSGVDKHDGYPIQKIDVDNIDPRSPSGCRTPINFAALNTQIYQKVIPAEERSPIKINENPLGALRKRFLKNFNFNLNDPRSPSSELNRTPLILDENDRTFNMNDTFADLFVESRAMPDDLKGEKHMEANMIIDSTDEINQPNIVEETNTEAIEGDICSDMISLLHDDDETLPCPAVLNKTPVIDQQEIDPRSPTYGVLRTPILFEENGEVNENEIIENVLATLSLDQSNSSIFSYGTPAADIEKKPEDFKPTNKHIERVRLGKKKVCITSKSARSRRQHQRIYEDSENKPSTPTTPKLKNQNSENNESKRTPLSCVKNRFSSRSRSVEISEKAIKTRLSLSSFDDNLNPSQNSKIMNLRILQSTEIINDF